MQDEGKKTVWLSTSTGRATNGLNTIKSNPGPCESNEEVLPIDQ